MIEEICSQYRIENYTINEDGSIDVNGNVVLCNKNLTELPLTFNKVTGYFDCSFNELTKLKGSPKWVGNNFSCASNQLKDLEYSPDYVGGVYLCMFNEFLNNPKGCPEKKVNNLLCFNTPLGSIFNNVDHCFLHAFNFYKIIKDDTVNMKRLKYVMDIYDQPINLDEIIKHYKIIEP